MPSTVDWWWALGILGTSYDVFIVEGGRWQKERFSVEQKKCYIDTDIYYFSGYWLYI